MFGIEAMEAEVAVVAFNCRGIPEAAGRFVVLVNRTPRVLLHRILETLGCEQRRKRLEEERRQFAYESYAWSNIASQFASMVTGLLQPSAKT